ncbi:MAG TPA: ABC transporter permease, partial [Vicinamibacterales bacterium]|nr:ABC transporter permease [Vicinamibacterales bacterium]
MLQALFQDSRYAVRWLLKSPGFSLVAIISLGLGIGFNTAIFAVVDALLLRPLPVREPARLVDLYTSGADGDTYSTNSLPDVLDYRAQTAAFEDVAAYSPMFAGVSAGDRAKLVLGEVVTGNYFTMLGVGARLGRTILASDDQPSSPRTIVLSERYWKRELGGDPAAIGRTLRVRGQQFTIVGVVADSFTGMVPMLAPEVWVPARYAEDIEPVGINETVPSPTGTSILDRRGQRWLFVKARLKPGATIEQARAHVDVVAARLAAENPQTNKGRRVTVRLASETRLHPQADAMLSWVVTGTMIAVGLVLVIACANVAGMLLARASARQREIGIRLAVGAGRGRLVRQLLTESVILGLLGAVTGVVLAAWLTRMLTTFDLPIPVPISLDLRLDVRVLGFAAVVALLTGVLAGLAPAMRFTRANLVGEIKGDRSGQAGRSRWHARDALVVCQMAVTIVLLVCAGLLIRSIGASQRANVGFRTDGLAIVSGDPGMLRYTPERSRQYWSDAIRRLEAIPGVKSVALASRVPFSLNFNNTQIAVPGVQKTADEPGPAINSANISPRYFTTLGIDVLQGRAFAATDTPDTRRLAIVSESFARKYWPGASAVGRVVYERTLNSGVSFEIVGVVADHKQQTVGEAERPTIYFSNTQRPSGYNVVIARTAGDDRALVGQMRETLLALEPDLLLLESQTMRAQIQAMLFPIRVAATLVTVFSGLGLLLAAVGLYGIIAFAVSERTREIGIRMAIGATPANVMRLVLAQGLKLAAAGLITGSLLGILATRLVAGALYGVSVTDPFAWGMAAAVLLGAAILANAIPALRAVRIDPVRA